MMWLDAMANVSMVKSVAAVMAFAALLNLLASAIAIFAIRRRRRTETEDLSWPQDPDFTIVNTILLWHRAPGAAGV